MSSKHVALIRGINVGRAKRVAMADLRAAVGRLGCTDVRTLLNSGNVVFTTSGRRAGGDAAGRIEGVLATELGVPARVTVLAAAELAAVVAENPLLDIATDPTRLLVAFLRDPADRAKLLPLAKQDCGAEAVAVGTRVAYLWCPDGLLASQSAGQVNRVLGDGVTSRNWATVVKLNALAADAR